MKTLYNITVPVVLAIILTAGCTKENPEPAEEVIKVEGVQISTPSIELEKGETFRLYATVSPENADDYQLEWSSSEPGIATVGTDGTVTALKAGHATITATVLEFSASCEVTVASTPVESIILNTYSLSLAPGDTVQLSAEVLPEDADDKTVTWSSEDNSIATVTEEGLVTALADGETSIMAQSGGIEAVCKVCVTTPIPQIGDIYYSDGTFSSEFIEGKEHVAVIFWTGNPAALDSALMSEHPECTHGLAVAITDAADGEGLMWQPNFTAFRQSSDEYKGVVGRWVENNTDYQSSVTQNTTESLMRAIGYNNTKGFENFNEAMPDYTVEAVAAVTAYGETVAAPEKSSGWYLPSIIELRNLICSESDEIRENGMYGMSNANILNDILAKIDSAEPIDGNYWSSSEHNQYTKAWSVSLTLQGRVWSQNKNMPYKVRPILAF